MKSLFSTACLAFAGVAVAEEVLASAATDSLKVEEARETPIVGKFAGNIYSAEYFKDSVYYDNISAFWAGYNM